MAIRLTLLTRRRGASHPVMLKKVVVRQGDQLVVARIFHHFVSDDARRRLRPVLVGMVAKVDRRRVRAAHQNLGDAVQRIAAFAEESMLRAHGAAMLLGVVRVGIDVVGQHMLGVELQDLGRLLVGPDHGVKRRHVENYVVEGNTIRTADWIWLDPDQTRGEIDSAPSQRRASTAAATGRAASTTGAAMRS